MEDLIIGLVLALIGGLNLFLCIKFLRKPKWAKNYIKKSPKSFLLRKIFGEERVYKLTKKVFVPIGIVIGGLFILVGLLFLFFYFGAQITGNVVNENMEDGVIFLEANDSRLVDAKAQAQKEIDYFIENLNVNPNYTHGIKAPFEDEENVEHMWVFADSYSDEKFYGELASQPEFVTNYQEGDKVMIHKQDVEDWAILDESDNVIKGDFLAQIMENGS